MIENIESKQFLMDGKLPFQGVTTRKAAVFFSGNCGQVSKTQTAPHDTIR
jgi:hypothetical protein